MKTKLLIFVCSLLAISSVFAQETSDSVAKPSGAASFFSRLYIPCEIGLAYSPAGTLKPGYTLKVALEWRHNRTKGLYYCFIYNDRAMDYEKQLLESTNLTKGKAHYSDIIIGPGYRFEVCKNFRIGLLVQAGVSICDYNSVVESTMTNPNGSEPLYDLVNESCVVAALRMSAYFEYYLGETFALFISAGYTQHLQPTPFSQTLAKDGCLGVNVGFTTSLF